MKRAFLLFTVAILYCNFTLAQEPDPDPNLLWKTENSYDRFLVHPNGNILAGKGYVDEGGFECELDGNTGTRLREFVSPLYFFDISPDGKYISAMDESFQRCVLDYETGKVIARLTKEETYPKFMPDSRTLVYVFIEPIDELNGNTRLQSYNIETGEYKTSETLIRYTTTRMIAVSPNGKYVATGGTYFGPSGKNYTQLILWDAETLEPIKILGEFENSREVRSIKFSHDSKLVGFQVYASNLYIYSTENLQLYKYYNEASGFGFITNEYVALGNGYAQPPVFNLVNLNNDQIIFTKNNSSGISDYNEAKNTMLVNYGVIYCYDFEKILTGASIKPEIANPFLVEYINNSLSIRNYAFVTNSINCTITDINGRMIRNLNLNTSTNEIRIPIKLQSGIYFLHIKDGSKEYVSKFCVVN
ncbi:MAG: T9SS type A sorting domain-containing protein [Desulfobulbaceae bacterium]|nr:T9SS type A sorting domain-containing protein [Desulfobulbaceae bacterium]